MNVLVGLVILAVFYGCCVALVVDVGVACEEAEAEARLDELWADDDEELARAA